MPKPALGKGMKDLLPKNMGASVRSEEDGYRKAQEELKINRQRYAAQGYDVRLLDELRKKDEDEITRGIESFRDEVKQLMSAQTVIRSVEGYGYSEEIAAISRRIKDPAVAEEVLRSAEELKKRVFSEHDLKNVNTEQGGDGPTPPEEVQETPTVAEGPPPDELDFDADELDGLLDDLDSAFNGEGATQEPPVESLREESDVMDDMVGKIMRWSQEGYDVEHLMEVVQEDQERAIRDVAAFEMGLSVLPGLKERLENLDRTGRENKVVELEMMLSKPHLFETISAGIDELESVVGPADEEEKKAPEGDDASGQALLESAKDAYREGDLETALARFQEVLDNDPSNAKAKFMIRRISQKM